MLGETNGGLKLRDDTKLSTQGAIQGVFNLQTRNDYDSASYRFFRVADQNDDIIRLFCIIGEFNIISNDQCCLKRTLNLTGYLAPARNCRSYPFGDMRITWTGKMIKSCNIHMKSLKGFIFCETDMQSFQALRNT